MSHRDNFDESANRECSNASIPTVGTENEHHAGAACVEILNSENSEIENLTNEEVDDYGDFPVSPPSNSPISQMVYNDLFRPSFQLRRLSYFPANSESAPTVYHRDRAPSLPTILVTQIGRPSPESFLKKLLYDSRRSSMESAYHSHGSGRSSRTHAANVQLEDMEYSQEYSDTIFSLTAQSMIDEMSMNEVRRDSLSYEAIREYFLEFNPYISPTNTECPCSEHRNDPNGSLFCPRCNQRRVSIDATNIYFRTAAHRMIVERQFEELFNIPDPSRSRSTSVDLFAGIDIPFSIQENPAESPGESVGEENKDAADEPS